MSSPAWLEEKRKAEEAAAAVQAEREAARRGRELMAYQRRLALEQARGRP